MQGPYLRKYGVGTTVDFILYETDGASLKVDAVHAAGDTKIMKDEGAEANTASGFVDEGQGYSIALSATEMEAARIVVYVVDQTSPAVWLADALIIETYGHASAQHAFDLDSNLQGVADEVLKRGVANVEDTADMDSLAALILSRLHAAISGTTLTIYKVDDATAFDTKDVTKSASADPITSVADP